MSTNMQFRYATRNLWTTLLAALAVAAFLIPADSAEAQRRKRRRTAGKAKRSTSPPRRSKLKRRQPKKKPANPAVGNKFAANKKPNPAPVNGKAHSSLKSVDKLVREFLKTYKIPGATVAVTRNGRLLLSKGYGFANANKKIEMLPTHRTKIGSVSKIITTAAIMKMHQRRNDFNVDRRMYGAGGLFTTQAFQNAKSKAIATHKPKDPWMKWYNNTRIKHLLSHSAGWERSGSKKDAAKMFGVPENKVTPRQVHLAFLSKQPLLHKPGSKSQYSNRGMGVMAHVIERVSGKKYKPFVKQHILHPIGLKHVLGPEDGTSARDAAPHKYNVGGKSFTAYDLEIGTGSGAAGGWRATAQDLARFMAATDQLSNHSDILSKSTLQLMESRPFPETVPGWALGWHISIRGAGKKLSHNGMLNGGTAYIVKYTPGYKALDGTNLSHINVAICLNIRNKQSIGGMSSLAGKIAKKCGKANIVQLYDLFKQPGFKVAR